MLTPLRRGLTFSAFLLGRTGSVFTRLEGRNHMFVVRVEIRIVIKKLELRVVFLFSFDHDFHLRTMLTDEQCCFLNDGVLFHGGWLLNKKDSVKMGFNSSHSVLTAWTVVGTCNSGIGMYGSLSSSNGATSNGAKSESTFVIMASR
jgi:hypothetical protein